MRYPMDTPNRTTRVEKILSRETEYLPVPETTETERQRTATDAVAWDRDAHCQSSRLMPTCVSCFVSRAVRWFCCRPLVFGLAVVRWGLVSPALFFLLGFRYFSGRQRAELFRLKGRFFEQLDMTPDASHAFSQASQLCGDYGKAWFSWARYCDALSAKCRHVDFTEVKTCTEVKTQNSRIKNHMCSVTP